jgi:hypothetical protein
MQPGKNIIAKAIDAGITQGSKGPQAAITFQNEAGETIRWYGNLDKDYSIKVVETAGFIGNSWEDFAHGMTKFANPPPAVSLDIEMGSPNPATGKSFPRVSFVNSTKSLKVMDPSQVKGKLPLGKFGKKEAPKPDAGF